MDFFSAQDAARKKTWRLAILFSAAVITLIVLTNLLLAFAATFMAPHSALSLAQYGALESVPWEHWAIISTGVVGVVGCATIYKYFQVSGGGRAIAESLGGRLLTHEAAAGDLAAKRLLNIVEEMAIASGTPVPPVYLIDEPSINAFAAGFTMDDAVVGINRGTIDSLSRDELQGVVAHEFSHILNGDMRINLRLIAVLHGIVFLGMIGYGILRGGTRVRSRGNGAAPLLIVALGLIIIGYGGTFFGKWIKSAVSRQREYLADAAAVQFTRNPQGISGALKKIGGSMYGSTIASTAAEEAAHLFFGDVVAKRFSSLFATHPPLEKRILAIEPRWDGQFASVQTGVSTHPSTSESELVSGFHHPTAEGVVASVGETSPDALVHAHQLIDHLAPTLREAAHDVFTARALIYAMLLNDGSTREQQLTHIAAHADTGVADHVARLAAEIAHQDALQRVTLIECAVPTLKSLSAEQYKRFVANVRALIKADEKIELFEWVLYRVLTKELAPQFEKVRPPRIRYRTVKAAGRATRIMLGAVAQATHKDAQTQVSTLNNALTNLQLRTTDEIIPFELNTLNKALRELRALHPLQKPAVLKAAASITATNPTAAVGALLHGIAATMDCPLPISAFSEQKPNG